MPVFNVRGSKGQFWHGYMERGYIPDYDEPLPTPAPIPIISSRVQPVKQYVYHPVNPKPSPIQYKGFDL